MQTLVAEILTAWRRAERLGTELPDGSAEQRAAREACERLRDAYQALTSSGAARRMTEDEARALVADVTSITPPKVDGQVYGG